MSDAVQAFPITVPNTTPIALEFPTPLGLSDVQDILVVVPPGPAGLVGFQIWSGGSPVYPIDESTYFVFDDYTYEQIVSSQIKTGQWSIFAYNNDVFDHSFTVYYRYNYVVYSPSLLLSPIVGL